MVDKDQDVTNTIIQPSDDGGLPYISLIVVHRGHRLSRIKTVKVVYLISLIVVGTVCLALRESFQCFLFGSRDFSINMVDKDKD